MANMEMLEKEESVEGAQNMMRLMGSGGDGNLTDDGLVAKRRQIDWFRHNYDYRRVATCVQCTHCITIKGFQENGQCVVKSRICTQGRFETEGDCTCNMVHLSKNGKVKVFYIVDENMPRKWIEAHAEENRLRKPKEVGEEEQEVREEELYLRKPKPSDYQIETIGGSGKYKRKSAEIAKDGGAMPKGLTN